MVMPAALFPAGLSSLGSRTASVTHALCAFQVLLSATSRPFDGSSNVLSCSLTRNQALDIAKGEQIVELLPPTQRASFASK